MEKTLTLIVGGGRVGIVGVWGGGVVMEKTKNFNSWGGGGGVSF